MGGGGYDHSRVIMHQLMHWRTTEGWTEKNLRRRVKDRKPEEKEAFFPPSDGV